MTPKRNDPDMESYSGRFAARLYELRKKAKLNSKQAAELIGVNEYTLLHWEANRRSPPVDTYPILAETYKLKKTKDLLPNE